MSNVFLRCLALLILVAGPLAGARAGSFMLPPGEGQFIGSVGYSEGSRSFRKAEASGYLEYGLTPWLSLIAAPTLSHEHDAPATNAVTGSDSSAFGGRLQLYGAPGRVVAVQVLVQPPIGAGNRATQLMNGGARTLSADLRLGVGQAFDLFGKPAFVDVQPGARVRTDPFPTEARLDVAAGVRPRPDVLVLVQDFSSWAPRDGVVIPSASYSKLQGSLVYDVSRTWSVQVGGVRTIAGRNAVRETGPFGAIWYRF